VAVTATAKQYEIGQISDIRGIRGSKKFKTKPISKWGNWRKLFENSIIRQNSGFLPAKKQTQTKPIF